MSVRSVWFRFHMLVTFGAHLPLFHERGAGLRKLALICLTLGGSPAALAAYSPPVGIPMPPLCVEEQAPAQPDAWPGGEAPGYFYIDNTHPSATDSGNPYGYPDRPRLTIPERYQSGEYVEIHGGPYNDGQLNIEATGTAIAPVWIRGTGPSQRPTIRDTVSVSGSYVFVEYLRFDRSRRTLDVEYGGIGTHHVCVRNNVFDGPGIDDSHTSVLGVSGVSGSRTYNVVIYNNLIRNFGEVQTSNENDYHGILPGRYSDHIWVLENEVHHMGGDSIQVGQANYSAQERPHHVYVGRNLFHEDRENAVDIKSSADVIVSENTCYGYSATSSSAGEVIVIHDDPDQVWVLANKVFAGNRGIVTTGSTNTYFIGNVVYDIHHPSGSSWDPDSGYSSGAAMHFRGGSTSGGAINNTLYDYDTGIQLMQGSGSGYVLVNNIFSFRAENQGYDILVGNGSLASASTIDYSLFYDNDGGVRIDWDSGTALSVSELQTQEGQCGNCPAPADPSFQDRSSENLTVTVGSPAIDAGTAHAIYDTFQSQYGIDIRRDITGAVRPSGPAWDIGAYEVDPDRLMPPQNVRLLR